MIEVKAPQDYSEYKDKYAVFLAGSIEMGQAEKWQAQVVEALSPLDVLALNPRRDDWNSDWAQRKDNPHFREQVEWELSALEHADTIVVYFAPGTKSPITLMELGLHAIPNAEKLIVCCPEGFWRKGNVDIVCARFGVRQVDTLDALVNAVIKEFQNNNP